MKIKICGITNLVDAQAAVAAGADMLGYIFVPKSGRYIEPEAAAAIIAEVPGVQHVGVFVDESSEDMLRIGRLCGLDILQLHGAEPAAQFAELAEFACIKALAVRVPADLQRLQEYPNVPILLDSASGTDGGSGETGDWQLARLAADTREIILAGGLYPENVAAAIAAVRPVGVDVSTGVEQDKRHKDHAKIQAFIRNARAAALP
jgi:indole-3-glycerol phosphate synthase/phosphoribosylanthranilate isomerase